MCAPVYLRFGGKEPLHRRRVTTGPDNGGKRVSDQEHKSIADSERSPSSEAADDVNVGPPGTNPEDEERPEPEGTSGSDKQKTGPDGKPVVPPSRGTTH